MKIVQLLAAVLGIGTAFGTAQVYFQETQPASRTAPTLVTDGTPLAGIVSFHAEYSCSDGSNVTAGNGVWWYYSPKLAAWVPGQTYANFTLATGGPRAIGPELQVTNPYGRHTYQSVGVACSGGSWDGGVLLTIEQNQQ
jgi:hypothetical protein